MHTGAKQSKVGDKGINYRRAELVGGGNAGSEIQLAIHPLGSSSLASVRSGYRPRYLQELSGEHER